MDMLVDGAVLTANSMSDSAIDKRTARVWRHLSLEDKVLPDIGCNNGLHGMKFSEMVRDIISVDIGSETSIKAR